MKILHFAVVCAIFSIININAGFFSSEKDVNTEIQQKLTAISNETETFKQMSEMRSLMIKNRKVSANSTTQNLFGNTLQNLFNKRKRFNG